MRDIAEKHGSYRRNENTDEAVNLMKRGLDLLKLKKVFCWLDKPISFSGLLAEQMRCAFGDMAVVEAVESPDYMIKAKLKEDAGYVVVSGDSVLLSKAERS